MACAQRMIYTTSEEERLAALAAPAFATRSNCAAWRAGKLDLDKRPPASVSGRDTLKPKGSEGYFFSEDFITRRVLIAS